MDYAWKFVCILFNIVILWAVKWLIADYLGYGWAGYGLFVFLAAFWMFVTAAVFYLIAAIVENL